MPSLFQHRSIKETAHAKEHGDIIQPTASAHIEDLYEFQLCSPPGMEYQWAKSKGKEGHDSFQSMRMILNSVGNDPLCSFMYSLPFY